MTKIRPIRIAATVIAATAVISISAGQTPERAGKNVRKLDPVVGVRKYSSAYSQALLTRSMYRQQLAQQGRTSTWLGTKIDPQPRAEGKTLSFQKQVSALFARLDLQPDARLAHFAWCDQYPLVCRGWAGRIETISPSPAGWLIRVRVRPVVVSQNVCFSDSFLETYVLSEEGLSFLGGVGPAEDEDGGIALL